MTQIRCRSIIEILGKPKKHVEDTIAQYTDRIKKDAELSVIDLAINPTKEQDKGYFSTFAELEIVVQNISKLLSFGFDYMPSSMEVVKPEQLKITEKDLTGFLNDLQARLHQVDAIIKNLRSENTFLKRNLNSALQNVILIVTSLTPRSFEELKKITGIAEKELNPFLEKMLADNRVVLEDDKYRPKKQD